MSHGARGRSVSWAVVLIVSAVLAVAGAIIWGILNVVGLLNSFEVHTPKCDAKHHLIYRPQSVGSDTVLFPTCAEGHE